VERANEILPRRDVDASLATDTRVNHGQQRCWDLHKLDAPHVRRRNESGEVADDTPAQRHNHSATIIPA